MSGSKTMSVKLIHNEVWLHVLQKRKRVQFYFIIPDVSSIRVTVLKSKQEWMEAYHFNYTHHKSSDINKKISKSLIERTSGPKEKSLQTNEKNMTIQVCLHL